MKDTSSKKAYTQHKSALLLTGGGARAAYQVGVLKGIASFIPRNHGTPFPILCGTSAGSINATALACYASCYHLGVKKLEWVWRNFHTRQVYQSHLAAILRQFFKNTIKTGLADYAETDPACMFDTSPLRDLINHVLDFSRIDRNIANGYLSALSVTASNYNTGNSICFYQGDGSHTDWQRAKRQGMASQINVEHLMASSAIPLVFPSVRIQQQHYGDGSVHQLSPLSPPIHLGAERIFVVGVQPAEVKQKAHLNSVPYPSSAAIAGHLLDTIFADTLNADIERLQRINNTLDLLTPDDRNKVDLRPIETLVINPSEDFSGIANEHFSDFPFAVRQMFRMMGINADSSSSLASYLLFEKRYCQQLLEIGMQDALKQKDEILAFLRLD